MMEKNSDIKPGRTPDTQRVLVREKAASEQTKIEKLDADFTHKLQARASKKHSETK